MSLLDELKQKADEQRKASDQSASQAQQEAYYQESIRPRMLAIWKYLGELIEQLEVIDLDVRHHYSLPGIGDVQGLRQSGYIVNADSTDQIKTVRLRFHCEANQEKEYPISPKELSNETRDFLVAKNMRFAEWPIRDHTQQIVGVVFQLNLKVDIQFLFQADLEKGAVRMASSNFSDFGVEKSLLQPEKITDEWLDHLGNYLLRRNQNLHNLEIDDTDRALIRQKLEEEKQMRLIEMQQVEQREREELEEKRRKSLLVKLKNLGESASRKLRDTT